MFALTTFPFCLLVATLEATPILSEHLRRVCRGDQSGWGSSVTRLSLFLAEQMWYGDPAAVRRQPSTPGSTSARLHGHRSALLGFAPVPVDEIGNQG